MHIRDLDMQKPNHQLVQTTADDGPKGPNLKNPNYALEDYTIV
jgi:hypothetical protein